MLKFFLRKNWIVLTAILCIFTWMMAERTLLRRSAMAELDGRYIAVVIDDYGNEDSEGKKEMLELGIPLTAAVMPGLSSSALDADTYHQQGHDIILHQPMEPKRGNASWLGPFAIKKGMSAEEAKENVERGLASVQVAIGINNHMGSRVMEDEALVRAVMETAKEKDLVFINSVTTGDKTARSLAEALGVAYFERDYFLDDVKSVANTKKEMKNAAKKADAAGYAIVIGHVGNAGGRSTVQGLREIIPQLQEEGYEFVTISQLKALMEDEEQVFY